ncbi:hypothetical protein L1987_31860 [Smallanthus sonchifolius]|uniref:Uncharacterized protein n=1 Tax=Smallanthus sonchifolius TaxID=185202 RepID=A0ACB9I6T4_9ASTR|nr:hypothetical protein L1987_31860 [Smallanthus sonchifolius]
MAKEVSTYEECWWKTHSWFTSNENFDDELKQKYDEKIACDDVKSPDRNMSIDGGEKEINVGVIEKRKGKDIDFGSEGDDHKGKRYQPYNSKIRVSTERKRRNKETKLYEELLALLPRLSAKAHKATILEEAMQSIISLQETLSGLEKQKLERLHGASQSPVISNTESPNLLINKGDSALNLDTVSDQSSNSFKTYASSNVTLNVCGADALISMCSKRIPELFTDVCCIFEKHNMEVVYTGIYSDHAKIMYMIRVRVNVPPELAEGFPYEEMYTEAAAQIGHLVTLQN